MFDNDQTQGTNSVASIADDLRVLAGLSVRGRKSIEDRDRAVAAISARVTELAAQAARVESLEEDLATAEQSSSEGWTTAHSTADMGRILRDLTRLFLSEELNFRATGGQGLAYQITGSEILELSIDFGRCDGAVSNTAKPGRRPRHFYVDERGLSVDAFVAIEALFDDIELTSSNTPRRLHRELFSAEEPKPPVPNPALVKRLANALVDMVMPVCSDPNCPWHDGDSVGISSIFLGGWPLGTDFMSRPRRRPGH